MTPKSSTKTKLTFNIAAIQVLKFTINNAPEFYQLPPNNTYAFETNVEVNVESNHKIIAIDFLIKVFTSEDKNTLACELHVRMIFNILNFNEVINISASGLAIPDPVLYHFISTTIGTTRGIFFEKVRGTYLANIILPPINVTNLKKQNVQKK